MNVREEFPLRRDTIALTENGRVISSLVVYTMDPAVWHSMCDEIERLREGDTQPDGG